MSRPMSYDFDGSVIACYMLGDGLKVRVESFDRTRPRFYFNISAPQAREIEAAWRDLTTPVYFHAVCEIQDKLREYVRKSSHSGVNTVSTVQDSFTVGDASVKLQTR